MRILKHCLNKVKKKFSGCSSEDRLTYHCNICNEKNSNNSSQLSREEPSCNLCGSTVRMRAIIHVLSIELFGESVALPNFPIRKDLYGIGMSDWDGYAIPLSKKIDYMNTYYHQEPKLDITSVSEKLYSSLDFIISSDVFEHVLYPVSKAFNNTRYLLKAGGVFIFTVPYTKDEHTIEHFGKLNDYSVTKNKGQFILTDIADTGETRTFENLVFHGGPGSTLEMRIFSEKSLMSEFANAGFKKIKIYSEPCLKFGIYWGDVNWSLPISARK